MLNNRKYVCNHQHPMLQNAWVYWYCNSHAATHFSYQPTKYQRRFNWLWCDFLESALSLSFSKVSFAAYGLLFPLRNQIWQINYLHPFWSYRHHFTLSYNLSWHDRLLAVSLPAAFCLSVIKYSSHNVWTYFRWIWLMTYTIHIEQHLYLQFRFPPPVWCFYVHKSVIM